MTFQRFKLLLLVLGSFSANSQSYGELLESSFEYTYKAMDSAWSFLPEVPAAFESSDSNSYTLASQYNNFGLSLESSDLVLNLTRLSEPKDVSLKAKKLGVSASYSISDTQKLNVHVKEQKADQQRFNCYSAMNIVLGGCASANIQIASNKPKYDHLDGALIEISAATSTIGIEYRQLVDWRWLDEVSVGAYSTRHDYDWLSPVEDFQSPFLLGLTINGALLGDALSETISRLPQRDTWRINQFNLHMEKAVHLSASVLAFAKTDVVYLAYDNYQALKSPPKYNAKIKVGLRITRGKLSMEVFADAYKNNLLGFEAITFNQRTEHYFNKAYAEIGLRLVARI